MRCTVMETIPRRRNEDKARQEKERQTERTEQNQGENSIFDNLSAASHDRSMMVRFGSGRV